MRLLLFAFSGLFVLGSGPCPARAQTTASMNGGGRVAALGGAGTALQGDSWGRANPSAWATLSGRAVGFFASQAYGLSELRLGAIRYVEPTGWGSFAAGAQTFGFEDFRETQFVAGYAKGFSLGTSRRFYAGLSTRYERTVIGGGYGSAGAFGFSVGALVSVLPRLTLGAQATNLNAPEIGSGNELPRTLAIGLSYRPTDRLLIVTDGFKDINHPLSLRAGLEILPVEVLALRAGVTTQPTRFTAGVGVHLGRLRADLATERHEALGWTPAASLGLQW